MSRKETAQSPSSSDADIHNDSGEEAEIDDEDIFEGIEHQDIEDKDIDGKDTDIENEDIGDNEEDVGKDIEEDVEEGVEEDVEEDIEENIEEEGIVLRMRMGVLKLRD